MFESRFDIGPFNEKISRLEEGLKKLIVGQEEMIRLVLTAMIGGGHVLLEGPPGLAKTMTARLLSNMLGLKFSRLQFTPDLMPSDILGTSIFNFQTSTFDFKEGPIFAQFVLADEINRAPAKTQSALFEVMEERQISIEGKKYTFDPPFFIVATQNPIDMEGTYRLPEAQMDRFMFKINLDYPNEEEEVLILKAHLSESIFNQILAVEPVMQKEEMLELMSLLPKVVADEKILVYIAQLVQKTRHSKHLMVGASPRGSISMLNAARAWALLEGRDFITPDDVKSVAVAALNHRVILTPEREMEGVTETKVIKRYLDIVEVPR
jgi:MoxR-like ATPase